MGDTSEGEPDAGHRGGEGPGGEHADAQLRWVVYVLWSASRSRFYTGVSTDGSRRLRQHNGALKGGAKATRAGRPWLVVYRWFCATRSEAQIEEARIKKLSHDQKRQLPGVAAFIRCAP
jgi:predicted GIY-YIG superfamily endonuclease